MSAVKARLEILSEQMGLGGEITPAVWEAFEKAKPVGRPPVLGEDKHRMTMFIEQRYLDRARKLYPNMPMAEAVRTIFRSGLLEMERITGKDGTPCG